jgi:hypothetical protein
MLSTGASWSNKSMKKSAKSSTAKKRLTSSKLGEYRETGIFASRAIAPNRSIELNQ